MKQAKQRSKRLAKGFAVMDKAKMHSIAVRAGVASGQSSAHYTPTKEQASRGGRIGGVRSGAVRRARRDSEEAGTPR